MKNNQFHRCKSRSSANYQNYCENHRRTKSGRCFENKTACWNLASLKKIQRNESAKHSIFLPLSFLILSPGKAIFTSLTTFHCRYPAQVHSELIVYVQCPCSPKSSSLLGLLGNSAQKKGQLLQAILLSLASRKFISFLFLGFSLEIKEKSGYRIKNWICLRSRSRTFPRVEPDC